MCVARYRRLVLHEDRLCLPFVPYLIVYCIVLHLQCLQASPRVCRWPGGFDDGVGEGRVASVYVIERGVNVQRGR